jgi:hypothetical protein
VAVWPNSSVAASLILAVNFGFSKSRLGCLSLALIAVKSSAERCFVVFMILRPVATSVESLLVVAVNRSFLAITYASSSTESVRGGARGVGVVLAMLAVAAKSATEAQREDDGAVHSGRSYLTSLIVRFAVATLPGRNRSSGVLIKGEVKISVTAEAWMRVG